MMRVAPTESGRRQAPFGTFGLPAVSVAVSAAALWSCVSPAQWQYRSALVMVGLAASIAVGRSMNLANDLND